MMISKVNHMSTYVLDQDKAFDVYVNKMGFIVNTDITMDNGFRWLTVNASQQPDLELVLINPGPPMFDNKQVEAINTLLKTDAMGGGVLATNDSH